MTTRTKGVWLRALAVAAALAAAAGTTLVAATGASATPSPDVTICHATSAVANPYVVQTVNTSSADEARNTFLNGHGDHVGPVFSATMVQGDSWGDVIPPFTYTYVVQEGTGQDKVDVEMTETFAGLNWDASGQAVYANGCTLPPVYLYTPSASATATRCTLVDGSWKDVTYGATATGSPLPKSTPWTAGDMTAADTTMQPTAAADLALKIAQATTDPTGASCAVTPPTPPSAPPTPATVTAPEAATVTAPQAATVAVPEAATVPAKGPTLPAEVPGGDGSSVPTVPPIAVALLALSAAVATASAIRLVRSRS